jgi:hypothetical protein
MHPGASTLNEVDLLASLNAFRGLPVGVAVWQLRDPNDVRSFRFVGVNPACERELRAPLGFAVGKSIAECFPKLLDTHVPERYRRVVLSGKPDTIGEFAYRDSRIPDGVFWIDCFPLPNECVGIALKNISERSRMSESQGRALDVLHRISVYLNEAPTVLEAAQFCLDEICTQIRWPVGRFFLSDESSPSRYLPNPVWHLSDPQRFAGFRKATELYETNVTNRLTLEYRTIQAQKAGLTRTIGFSVIESDFLRGVLEFSSEVAEPLDETFKRAISNVGFQLGQVFARERTARECQSLHERIESYDAQRDSGSRVVFLPLTSLSAVAGSPVSLIPSPSTGALSRQLRESACEMSQHLVQLKRTHHATGTFSKQLRDSASEMSQHLVQLKRTRHAIGTFSKQLRESAWLISQHLDDLKRLKAGPAEFPPIIAP